VDDVGRVCGEQLTAQGQCTTASEAPATFHLDVVRRQMTADGPAIVDGHQREDVCSPVAVQLLVARSRYFAKLGHRFYVMVGRGRDDVIVL